MLKRLKKLFGSSASPNTKKVMDDSAVIIDVRTSFEFKKGHLKESKNIPLNILPYKTDELKKLNKPVITVCRSGSRSIMAKEILSKAGIEVYDGGAWTNLQKKVKQ